VGAAKYQKKSNVPALLDLDGDEYGLGEDSDDDPDNDLISREIKQLAILDRSLLTCQRCGPNIYCKIDKAGTHVALTMPQRRAWANTLACFDFVNQCLANIDSGTVEPWCHSLHPPKSSFIQCLFYPSSPLLISSTTSH